MQKPVAQPKGQRPDCQAQKQPTPWYHFKASLSVGVKSKKVRIPSDCPRIGGTDLHRINPPTCRPQKDLGEKSDHQKDRHRH